MDKLNLAEELKNSGRPMTVDSRIYNLLSKEGVIQVKDFDFIAQATWLAWERGYKQAVEDIKNYLIDLQ